MAQYGYARVSTNTQNTDKQIEALTFYGCDRVFEEKISGVARERPQLTILISGLEVGDSVVVTTLDRFARSTKNLLGLLEEIESKGCFFICLNPFIDTSETSGKLVLTVLGAIAEFERNLINERCQEGKIRAREAGVKFGRRKLEIKNKVMAVIKLSKATGKPINKVCKDLGISKQTFYRRRREMIDNGILRGS